MWFERSDSSEVIRGAVSSHHSSSFFSFLSPGPPHFSSLFPFILVFNSPSSSTCQFLIVWGNYSSYQSSRQSGWEKLDSMVWGMGLSGAGLHVMVLAAFSLELLLYWICPFLQAFLWDVGCEVVLGHVLGPSWSCITRPKRLGFIGQGFGPLTQSGLGLQISGPTE